MSLFISMLPIYLFGNLHCIGMCGPLVMMLGQHKYRYFYFLGRIFSFGLAGLIAGGFGAILNVALDEWFIPAMVSLSFGAIIIIIALYNLTGTHFRGFNWLSKKMGKLSQGLSLLLLKDDPYPTFLFGLGTILLPCGQTVVVFSACAIYGDPLIGLLNGAAFALLTSPSLWVAMRAKNWLSRYKTSYNQLFGGAALFIGVLALCRGLADLSIIPHLILNHSWHIVLY